MKKNFPDLKNDKQAEVFLEQDLSEFITKANFQPAQFEFLPKEKNVNLRMSEKLLNALRLKAQQIGIPYQKYIRQVLERELLLP